MQISRCPRLPRATLTTFLLDGDPGFCKLIAAFMRVFAIYSRHDFVVNHLCR